MQEAGKCVVSTNNADLFPRPPADVSEDELEDLMPVMADFVDLENLRTPTDPDPASYASCTFRI